MADFADSHDPNSTVTQIELSLSFSLYVTFPSNSDTHAPIACSRLGLAGFR
jgi:hypothetical protein